MKNKNNIICLMILALSLNLGILPSIAKIDGGISQSHFYDTEKTIMTEISPNKILKTGKYWEKNLLYLNKYKPLFMLSNKELYDLMPDEKVSVVQRITTPSVYNISLKTASIKKVSLAQPSISKPHSVPHEIGTSQVSRSDVKSASLISAYEQAKNPDTETDAKVDVAILLKNSQTRSNYVLAIDLLDDVTRKEPYNAYAFYLKGEIYSRQSDSKNAMQNYVEALKINPTSKQCCIGIARILEPTNRELAQKYYERGK